MVIIKHQFSTTNFYIPKWRIKYLFIGTFNPESGEKVPYYYSRSKNKTWELLSKIFRVNFSPNNQEFLSQIQLHGIACMDLIDEIVAPRDKLNEISGEGYKDSAIINKNITRKYNTRLINNIIKKNCGCKVYSTWGKGPTLKEWKDEVSKLGTMISLVSPSMAAKVPKGKEKFIYMLNDWKLKILLSTAPKVPASSPVKKLP